MEFYDITSKHDSKSKVLHEKIDNIHNLITGSSENRQEALFKTTREMR